MRYFGQDEEEMIEEPTVELPSPDGGTEVYNNVSEQAVLYDTIAITADLPNLAKQPPGWFATFALAGGAVDHSFFNVRNRGNCDAAYCNLDTRDQTAFAFRATGLGLSWWAQTWSCEQNLIDPAVVARDYIAAAIWQADLPIHASIVLKLQQDEKTKINSAMLCPGYGITGGGLQNYAAGALGAPPIAGGAHFLAANQGIPAPQAIYRFSNIIDIPRRASLSAVLSFSEYARQLIQLMPGPGTFVSSISGETAQYFPVMVGITAVLYGRRLVQQRGQLRA